MMAAWMTARDLDPELIICSTAVRTRQTLGLLQKTVDPERQIIQLRDDLYLADADDLVEIIRSVSRKVRHVMVLGHDPGLHDTALLLIGAGEAQLRHALTLKFPTAGVAVIDFDLDRWSNLSPGTGTLRHFMAPKRLPQD